MCEKLKRLEKIVKNKQYFRMYLKTVLMSTSLLLTSFYSSYSPFSSSRFSSLFSESNTHHFFWMILFISHQTPWCDVSVQFHASSSIFWLLSLFLNAKKSWKWSFFVAYIKNIPVFWILKKQPDEEEEDNVWNFDEKWAKWMLVSDAYWMLSAHCTNRDVWEENSDAFSGCHIWRSHQKEYF